MKESKTIKEYSGRLLDIVNNIRLLGFDFSNDRIVQKFLVTYLKNLKPQLYL